VAVVENLGPIDGRPCEADPVTRDQVLELCLSLPGAVEYYPFGDEVAVLKVGGKMFAWSCSSESPAA
jgi:hypothetical protein